MLCLRRRASAAFAQSMLSALRSKLPGFVSSSVSARRFPYKKQRQTQVQSHKVRFVMKRTITDYFGAASPTKKPKLAEAPEGVHTAPAAPVAPPVSTPKPLTQPVQNASSSKEPGLTLTEQAIAEANRKRALAKQLFQKITEPSWREALAPEFEKPYMADLADFVARERASGIKIYPAENDVFTALNLCPLDSIKVVIIGQDPYHQPNQAHGLCFSVLPPTPPPSSLKNIYKELKSNYPDFEIPKHGNLESWAAQGILMLNAVLTVRFDQPESHEGKGWEKFTDACIAAVSNRLRSVIFLLWGAKAKNKAKVADPKKQILLKAAHPSGLSASKGFFGCKHFIEVNKLLAQIGKEPINWQLPASGTSAQRNNTPAAAPSSASTSTTEASSSSPSPT